MLRNSSRVLFRKVYTVLSIMTFCALMAPLTGCSANASLALSKDGSATLGLALEIPEAVEKKLKDLSSLADSERLLLDPGTIAASAREKGFIVLEAKAPSKNSFSGRFLVKDLVEFSARPALATSKLLSYKREAGQGRLTIHIQPGQGDALMQLFPGIDEDLLEALQPPAFYATGVSKSEYRSMLASLLGKNAVEALDKASLSVSIAVPGSLVSYSGEGLKPKGNKGLELVWSVPLLDALVLEKPVLLNLAWKE